MDMKERYRERFGLECDFEISGNEFLERLMSRRSHRAFEEEPVSDDLMKTLFAAAFCAPSKSDLQQASVVRVTDPEKRSRIAALNDRVGWIAGAPEFMVWCGDSRRIRRLATYRKHPFANDHLDAFMNAAVDAGIAMQTFILAAESFGLGCCPVSVIRDNIDALAEELSLPEHVFPVAGLCVGWPAAPEVISMRLPTSVTVHENRYDDSNLIEEVEAYDRRREHAAPTPPSSQLDIDRFGVSEQYGWSEHRTRQYARCMRGDFGAFVRRQGFDLS